MKAANLNARYRKLWGELSLYGKFEHLIAIILATLIALVIAAATASLAFDVASDAIKGVGALKLLDYEEIFGRIMTVLIAFEFNVTIMQVLTSRRHLLQVRTVVLVAILALARKFIVIDFETESWEMLIALAVVVAALGGTYWIIGHADRHVREDGESDQGK